MSKCEGCGAEVIWIARVCYDASWQHHSCESRKLAESIMTDLCGPSGSARRQDGLTTEAEEDAEALPDNDIERQ